MDPRAAALKLVAEIAGTAASALRLDTELVADLGFDSAKALELVVAMEERLGVDVPDDALEGMATVGDVLDRVVQLTEPP